LLSGFRRTFSVPSKMVPKMAPILENGGLNIIFYVRDPETSTSLRGTACCGVFCVKIRPVALAVQVARTKKTGKKLAMRGNETPGRIVTNFCTGVGVYGVITSANFYNCRLRGLSVVGVKFWVSPLTCVVALTTLSHYRASDSFQ